MSAYRYVKKEVKKSREGLLFLPGFFLGIGLLALASAAGPILSYQLKAKERFSQKLLIPLSQASPMILASQSVGDYNQPDSWFPRAPELPPRPSKITHYTLSVPALKIKEAVVEIGGSDLTKSLVHYSGTALPGQYGNTVVFGHSTLVQFFNPKNYKTIFSTLPRLKKGDEILVDFDGVLYRYQVIKMTEVEPEDISVLRQYYDSQYLTLVTCVPPGTYLRRLVVQAKLK